MNASNLLPSDPFTEFVPDEIQTQFQVKSIHIIGSAILFMGWMWVGSLLIG